MHDEVNKILPMLIAEISPILTDNLIGLYLTGSLSYNDFQPDKSDIDLIAITKTVPSNQHLEALKLMHLTIEKENKKWSKRIECSYIAYKMLSYTSPPAEPRPYINEGCFYEKAHYGNEWIINLYLLYKYGVPLMGPDAASLIKGVNIEEVKKACVRDYLKEWQPRLNDLEWLSSSHQHSYTILTLCRILYTVIRGDVTSKTSAALWAKTGPCAGFRQLIEAAERWSPGKGITLKAETIKFIEFISNKISGTLLYKEVIKIS